MSTRRDKEAEVLLNWVRDGAKPPPKSMASRVGKFIFFPRGPISRALGTLLFRIMAGTTVGSAALFVLSVGAIVASVWLGSSDSFDELELAGMGGIVLALFWTFANFRRWAATEREVRHIESLGDEYMKGGEEYVSSMYIVELMFRLRHHHRLTSDQLERLAIVRKGMQDAAKPFDDTAKSEFVNLIASMLEVQRLMAGDADGSIEDENGHLKHKAIGYVYGYVDAALRSIGQDMADMSVGVPVTFQSNSQVVANSSH
jgi:hypothetical protein